MGDAIQCAVRFICLYRCDPAKGLKDSVLKEMAGQMKSCASPLGGECEGRSGEKDVMGGART